MRCAVDDELHKELHKVPVAPSLVDAATKKTITKEEVVQHQAADESKQ